MTRQHRLFPDPSLGDARSQQAESDTGRPRYTFTPEQLSEAKALLEITSPGTLDRFRALMREAMARGELHFREFPADEIGACFFAFSQLRCVFEADQPGLVMNELILTVLDELSAGLRH